MILLTWLTLVSAAQTGLCQTLPTPTGSAVTAPSSGVKEGHLGELRISAQQLVHALELGNVKALTELFDAGGVVFGIEPPPIDLTELRRQFEGRHGVYCLLFDTQCLRKEAGKNPNRKRLYSFRDLLTKASKRDISVNLVEGDEGPFGEVRVLLTGGPIEQNPGGRTLDFSLTWDGHEWRLAQVEYL
jgi:hypothetical protein